MRLDDGGEGERAKGSIILGFPARATTQRGTDLPVTRPLRKTYTNKYNT